MLLRRSERITLSTPNGFLVSILHTGSEPDGYYEVALLKESEGFVWKDEVRYLTPDEILMLLDEVQRY